MRQQKTLIASLVTVSLLTGYSYWALHRPLPALQPTATTSRIAAPTPAGSLNWPNAQAAVGIVGTKTLETHGTQTSQPMASTAKLITALIILDQAPLQPGQSGPTITLTAADVALYNQYHNVDGSVVPVVAGEQINEYQMLQALMLPSANNIADSLAIWKFGSLSNYALAANSWLKYHHLNQTHVGTDASGLSPSTTSSAYDLVLLGELAMQNPVLAGIVGQSTASGIPVVNNIKNVNFLLGKSNVVGVKTGNSDQAGGVFVGAAKITVNDRPVTIVTAYVGAPNLFDAVQGSLPFIQSAEANFKPVTAVKKAQVVGMYRLPWSGNVPAEATSDLQMQAWGGSHVAAAVKLKPVSATAKADEVVGTISADGRSVNVKLRTAITKPSAWWRLTHPFN